MRIAVVGGTGVAGRHAVAAARRKGHDVVVIARSRGVDVYTWTRVGDVATVPPVLVQPVAAADVGDVLADVAAGVSQGRAADLAGPEPQDLVDMARRTLAVRGRSVKLIASWRGTAFGVEAAGEMLLPGPDARLARTTFDDWLEQQRRETSR